MKKSVVAIASAVVLVGAYAGTTFVVGKQVGQRSQEAWDRLAARTDVVRVVDRQFKGGFMGSSEHVTLAIGCEPEVVDGAPMGSKPVQIKIRTDYRHGPIAGGQLALGSATTQVEEWPLTAQAPLKMLFGDRAPVEVKTVFGFGGKASSTLTVGAVEFNDPSSHVKTTPLVVSADVDGQGRLHGYRLRWDEVNAKFQGEKAGELKVSGVDFSATTQPLGTSPWLYGGDGTGVIRQVTFTPQAGSTAFALNDLKIKSHTGVQGETLEASTEMSAALKVGEIDIERIEAKSGYKGLNLKALDEVMNIAMKSDLRCKTIKEEDPVKRLAELQASVGKLLTGKPEFSLDYLKVTHKGQTGQIAYSLAADGLTADDLQTGAANPMALMNKLVVAASLDVPEALVHSLGEAVAKQIGQPYQKEAVSGSIQQGVMMGMITNDKGRIKSDISMKKGAVTVNGKPIPFPGMGAAPAPAMSDAPAAPGQ